MKNIAKRAAALLFVVALMMSMMVVPASAAQTSIATISGGNSLYGVITGKSPSNSYTYVIIQNKGNYPVWVWDPVPNKNSKQRSIFSSWWDYQLQPGGARTFWLSGNSRTLYVPLQGYSSPTSVRIVTNRGTAYWD